MKLQLLLVAVAVLFCVAEGWPNNENLHFGNILTPAQKKSKRDLSDLEKGNPQERVRRQGYDGCTEQLDRKEGTIISSERCGGDGSEEQYSNNVWWIFHTELLDEDGFVNIVFNIDIEPETTCNFDGISFGVEDGDVPNFVSTLCGEQAGEFSYFIEANTSMIIEFYTDFIVTARGFSVNYSIDAQPQFSTDVPQYLEPLYIDCHEWLGLLHGTLDSSEVCGMEGSDHYYDYARWNFSTDPVIENGFISVYYFVEIETHPGCFWDRITFGVIDADGEINVTRTACGEHTATFSYPISAGDSLMIQFFSDYLIFDKGFFVNYTVDAQPLYATSFSALSSEDAVNNCTEILENNHDTISSLEICDAQGSPFYENNAFYTLTTNAVTERMFANIYYVISIQGHSSCYYDGLRFGTVSGEGEIDFITTICGEHVGNFSFAINTGDAMLLRFYSDTVFSWLGFEIRYSIDDEAYFETTVLPRHLYNWQTAGCALNLENFQGFVDSREICRQNGSSTYPHNAVWMIHTPSANQAMFANIYYDIDIEAQSWCFYDRLDFGVIVNGHETIYTTLCGVQTGNFSYALLADQSVLMKFVSDSSVTGPGFVVQLSLDLYPLFNTDPLPQFLNPQTTTAYPTTPTPSDPCSNKTLEASGTIDSFYNCPTATNYFGEIGYINSASWMFLVHNNASTLQWVNILYSIDIEYSFVCAWDRLVFGASYVHEVTLCGTHNGSFSVPVAADSYFMIRFMSDVSVTEKGFTVVYDLSPSAAYDTETLPHYVYSPDHYLNEVCVKQLSSTEGNVDGVSMCGGDPDSVEYPNRAVWSLYSYPPVSSPQWVNLQFEAQLSTWSWGDGCDGLSDRIRFGFANGSERAYTNNFCGETAGNMSYSLLPGFVMVIEFYSNSLHTGVGFQVNYNFTEEPAFSTTELH